jgi:hypothetical protein
MFWSLATILMVFVITSYSVIACPSLSLTYASRPTNRDAIPVAEDVHSSESMKVPPSVGTFVILIPNEAHENWSDEKHKLISDKNS